MTALDLLMKGRFGEAADAYRKRLTANPDDLASLSGLASALMNEGQYAEAIPLKLRLHECDKVENPDSPGQLLHISCAYWCLEDRAKAIALTHELCASMLDGSISMAPDQAGGATFGLVMHYMATTAGDELNRGYALDYLGKLNVKYGNRPTLFRYPVQTVKQVLGELPFEDALEGATKARSLPAAYEAAKSSRLVLGELGVALFHDGVLCRASGDEAGCMERMQQVFDLGYQTESIRWQLARHEVLGKTR